MLKVSVAPADSTAIVKMSGKIGPDDSASVFSFVKEVLIGNYHRIVVDISECRDMDSTFMGMLILLHSEQSPNSGELLILNANPENMKALKMLGIEKVVPTTDLAVGTNAQYAPMNIGKFHSQKTDKIAFIEIAHRALADASKKNAEKFGPFLRLLEEEMSEKKNDI